MIFYKSGDEVAQSLHKSTSSNKKQRNGSDATAATARNAGT